MLGRKQIYERRMVNRNCYNGREYEKLITVENCACDKTDYQCDFGFKRDDSWSDGCVKDPNFHHDEFKVGLIYLHAFIGCYLHFFSKSGWLISGVPTISKDSLF